MTLKTVVRTPLNAAKWLILVFTNKWARRLGYVTTFYGVAALDSTEGLAQGAFYTLSVGLMIFMFLGLVVASQE